MDDQRLIATLAEQHARRSLVLFIGAGVSVDAGLPDWKALLAGLRAKLDVDEATDGLDVAQWYRDRHGRQALIAHVRACLGGDRGPGPLHRSLAQLAAPVIFTTNFDQLMERALGEAQGVPPDVIVEDAHIGLIDEVRRTTVVKLHGCLSVPNTIVLARDDYQHYADDHRAMIAYLQTMLATSTVLFVGSA